MTPLRPDYTPGERAIHWPTRASGEIIGALPAGYSDWLYIFKPDDAPTVRRYCGVHDLAVVENVTPLCAFRPHPAPDGGGAG